jgi:hypothetical protein
MRFEFKWIVLVVLLCSFAAAQGPPPDFAGQQPSTHSVAALVGTPPQAPVPRLEQMKNLIKTQVRRAIDGKPYPALQNWQPLTEREKFDYFLRSTYASRTFVNAGVDVIANRVKGHDRNPEYETGLMGLGQHYGIELATDETDVFFKHFFFPAILRQDPRYFRNPELPFFKRALYSMSRVIITRTDAGGETFNSSSILGAAASRVLGDLYVPGQRQGLHPLIGCVSYNLVRDAGMNLVHEFWPDFRRKFLHR